MRGKINLDSKLVRSVVLSVDQDGKHRSIVLIVRLEIFNAQTNVQPEPIYPWGVRLERSAVAFMAVATAE